MFQMLNKQNMCETAFKSLVLSHLDYAAPVWTLTLRRNTTAGKTTLQTNRSYNYRSSVIVSNLGWITLDHTCRWKYTLFHQIIYGRLEAVHPSPNQKEYCILLDQKQIFDFIYLFIYDFSYAYFAPSHVINCQPFHYIH